MSIFKEFLLYEKTKKNDAKNIVNKVDDTPADIVKLLQNNPQAYIKKKLQKHGSLETLLAAYMKLKDVTKADPDLQLLATSISQIVKRVEG